MNTPARPLVSTAYEKINHIDKYPNGRDIMAMVVANTGYSQEDGLVVNKNSIERGLFSVTAYHTFTYSEEVNVKTGARILFANPKEMSREINVRGLNLSNSYEHLDIDGFPKIGTLIHKGMPLLGMVNQIYNSSGAYEVSDSTVMVSEYDHGVVDKVILYNKPDSNSGDERVVKIRIVHYRDLSIGDKLSFLGMKGVVCQIRNDHDMPFMENGSRPDIILSPQGFPTRLMAGLLLYGSTSKLAAKNGRRYMSSAYTTPTPTDVTKQHTVCEHTFYDPFTGKQCVGTCYFTPSYYYRIKQQTVDKIFFKDGNSHVSSLTRQAVGGRSKQGGLRLGEMELNCNLSCGIMSTIKENMMNKSDKFTLGIDGVTGKMPLAVVRNKEFVTNDLNGVRQPIRVNLPYAAKLMIQELQGIGIDVSLFDHDVRSQVEKENVYMANAALAFIDEDEDDSVPKVTDE